MAGTPVRILDLEEALWGKNKLYLVELPSGFLLEPSCCYLWCVLLTAGEFLIAKAEE